MPFKVKEHLRKTKKGLITVRESSRKDRVKKSLVIGAGALTTLGLGALALRKLNPKAVLNTVTKISGKADDIAASKAKNVTNLVTNSKLTVGKQYKELSDPWLNEAVTVNKSTKALTTGNNKTKLLTGSRYVADDVPDPWNSKVSKPKLNRKQRKLTTTSESKEQVLLLKKGNYDAPDYVTPTASSNVTGKGKNLGAEIRSKRTLVKREPTDIKNANERLQLATKYKNSDSSSLQQTGANYERAAKEKLTIISKRSPSKKQTGLVTTRGNASQSRVKHPYDKSKLTTDSPTPKKKGKSRRSLLTGKSNPQQLADNFIDSSIKGAINKAGDNVADTIIPGSSQVGRTIRDVKSRAKQVERLSNELAESGDKVTSRRGFLKKTVNKVAEEASIKPSDAEKVAKGTVKRGKAAIKTTLKSGSRQIKNDYYTTGNRGMSNSYGMQVGERIPTRTYRKSQGVAESMSQIVRKWARWKSGNYKDGGYF